MILPLQIVSKVLLLLPFLSSDPPPLCLRWVGSHDLLLSSSPPAPASPNILPLISYISHFTESLPRTRNQNLISFAALSSNSSARSQWPSKSAFPMAVQLSSLFLFKYIFIWMVKRSRVEGGKQAEGEGETKRGLPLMVHAPNARNSEGWAGELQVGLPCGQTHPPPAPTTATPNILSYWPSAKLDAFWPFWHIPQWPPAFFPYVGLCLCHLCTYHKPWVCATEYVYAPSPGPHQVLLFTEKLFLNSHPQPSLILSSSTEPELAQSLGTVLLIVKAYIFSFLQSLHALRRDALKLYKNLVSAYIFIN